jgi:mannose-6-phosphate isomerase-like protein (cupin superfamily)
VDYDIRTDIKYGYDTLIDVGAIGRENEPWWNQSLTEVNDCVVRLGLLHGEFHWHSHKEEDEFFLVLEGKLLIDLKDRTVELGPQQGFTVARGVEHRTRAPERTVVLMVEKSSVVPTGD